MEETTKKLLIYTVVIIIFIYFFFFKNKKRDSSFDCIGSYIDKDDGTCDAKTGKFPTVYNITYEAINQGTCALKNTTSTRNCNVSCIGSWSDTGVRDKATGLKQQTYTISQNGWTEGVMSTQCEDNLNGAIRYVDCPVDCEYTDWTPWTPCSNGQQEKTRDINVTGKNGGVICIKDLNSPYRKQTQGCSNCQLGSWSGWTTCSGGTQSRNRINTEATGSGTTRCTSLTDTETQVCSNCQLGAWSGWTTCSQGTQSRNRTNTQGTGDGTTRCVSLYDTENQVCSDCQVGAWSGWSGCSSETNGTRSRNRTNTQGTGDGTTRCASLTDTEYQPCSNCIMSAWSGYGGCSASCGGGTQSRSRTVTTAAINGGTCPVNNVVGTVQTESQACNTQACTSACIMSLWSGYGPCSVSCGTGTKRRSRSVIFPAIGGYCPVDNVVGATQYEDAPCDAGLCFNFNFNFR